jgi:hypothetical protein
VWVFHAWAQPLPPAIALQGPIGADANLDFWVGGAAMAVPLAALSAGAAVTGSLYLSSVRCAWQAWAGWVAAVTAAITVEVIFIGLFICPEPVLGMKPGRVNWGLLALSAWFAVTGGAMITVIVAAARRASRPSALGPAMPLSGLRTE